MSLFEKLNIKRSSLQEKKDDTTGRGKKPIKVNIQDLQKKISKNPKLKNVGVRTTDTNAIKQSCLDQKKGVTTFIEVILNQELGEPFRRDAMKKPVKVAGIKKEDMKPQKSMV